MIQVFAALHQIGPRIEAGESPEVVDEMCLVKIPTLQSDLCPLDLLPLFDQVQHFLKALDTAKQLGCQPNFFTEDLDEPSRAETDLLDHLRDCSCVV